MADIYVRSTDGNNADNGSTWALANATLAGAVADAVAGDTVYVSQVHAEAPSVATTWNFPGTLASPIKIICGNDGAAPPTAVATTATVISTGASALTMNGHVYVYGITFDAATSGSQPVYLAQSSGDCQVYENCNFRTASGGANSHIVVGNNANNANPSQVVWKSCGIRFSAAGQKIEVYNAVFHWRGGSLLSGGTSPTALLAFDSASRGGIATIDGVDFSNASAGVVLVGASTAACKSLWRNCKLPASWSGTLTSGTITAGSRHEMYNCDATDTNYRLWVEDYTGSIKSETTIIRTGGASDGTTGLSWKMVSSANAEFPTHLLESPEIVIWNDNTGASKTVTVEIVHDSAGAGSGSKFQDDEIWLQVQYYGTSGFPLGAHITDCKADVLAAAANQADSSETWTTTGLASPVKQALSVTFTPQEKGYFIARVVLAKASKTVYVCPKATVS